MSALWVAIGLVLGTYLTRDAWRALPQNWRGMRRHVAANRTHRDRLTLWDQSVDQVLAQARAARAAGQEQDPALVARARFLRDNFPELTP